jgi:hypothetical protein
MAEYSKQWCEINDPDDLSYDFDILEEAKQLKPEHYVSLICEGFGFTAIGTDKDGNILLGVPTNESLNEVIWKSYNEVIK